MQNSRRILSSDPPAAMQRLENARSDSCKPLKALQKARRLHRPLSSRGRRHPGRPRSVRGGLSPAGV